MIAALGAASVSAASSPAAASDPSPALASHGMPSLNHLITEAQSTGRGTQFLPPTTEAYDQVRRWVEGAFLSGKADAPPQGYSAWAPDDEPGVFGLSEQGLFQGSGVYAFRYQARRKVIVEVPHSHHDRETLPVGLALFSDLEAHALLVNTVHRYHGATDESEADVAHIDSSVFQAVHEGALATEPDALVIAVHGFRKLSEDPDVIVSAAGTRADAACFADALADAGLGWEVGLYGDTVHRLGGLKSTQAAHVRKQGGAMIHLELARDIRRQLAEDEVASTAFTAALDGCVDLIRE